MVYIWLLKKGRSFRLQPGFRVEGWDFKPLKVGRRGASGKLEAFVHGGGARIAGVSGSLTAVALG